MTTNNKIKQEIQKLDPDAIIALYDLDTTNLGGDTYHFCEYTTTSGSTVEFNGITYSPIPLEITGVEYKGDGRMPRPRIKLSNVNLTFSSAIISYNDLIGAKLTRRRTFVKYLDGQPDADSSAQFPADIYYLERKVNHNKLYIEWELLALMDIEGVMIPKRQVLRDTCTHRYRVYKDGSFDYSSATCPYTGSNYYKADGTSTTNPAEDCCGRKLFDCRLRYPNDNDTLPTRAFPGVGKIGYPFRQ